MIPALGSGSYKLEKRIIQNFILRGTGSPIECFLDVRAYRLKIHYNTTGIGYVD